MLADRPSHSTHPSNTASAVSSLAHHPAGGSTVTIVEGQGRKVPEPVVTRSPAVFQTPLTVLINGRSASASEVLAGALRDNCRAVLVGDRCGPASRVDCCMGLGVTCACEAEANRLRDTATGVNDAACTLWIIRLRESRSLGVLHHAYACSCVSH